MTLSLALADGAVLTLPPPIPVQRSHGFTRPTNVNDIPILNAAAIVTRQRLELIGFKVVLKGMDWSTMQLARTSKEPPDKGGWNLLHTWWHAANVVNPAVHFGIMGGGQHAWYGWPRRSPAG